MLRWRRVLACSVGMRPCVGRRGREQCLTQFLSLHLASVLIKKEAKKHINNQSPFLYSRSLLDVPAQLEMGDECWVRDEENNILARGMFNPESLYRVRVLEWAHYGTSANGSDLLSVPLVDLITRRLVEAKLLRSSIGLPNERTSVYRLVNGEGDQLSGLVMDVFNESVIVVQSSAAWTEKHRHDIESAIQSVFNKQIDGIVRILWRPMTTRLSQECWTLLKDAKELEVSSKYESDMEIEVIENGLVFASHPGCGQKTGFYCDQRDCRSLVGSISKDKHILDLYCNTGGFTLNALQAGAKSVVAVDSSDSALCVLMSNVERNFRSGQAKRNDSYALMQHLDDKDSRVNVVKSDVVSFLQNLFKSRGNDGNSYGIDMFDIVICDPPKLATKKTVMKKAIAKYTNINALAMKAVRYGGILLTCSCSTLVAQDSNVFLRIVQEAGKKARRNVTVLKTMSAGLDHPVHIGFPEGRHLTVLIVRVS